MPTRGPRVTRRRGGLAAALRGADAPRRTHAGGPGDRARAVRQRHFLLFSGTSEIDQLYKVASVLGTPGRNDWPDGYSLANSMSFRFPTFQSTHLSQILGSRTSARAVSFLYALLAWNPSWRSSAQEALRYSYFRYIFIPTFMYIRLFLCCSLQIFPKNQSNSTYLNSNSLEI